MLRVSKGAEWTQAGLCLTLERATNVRQSREPGRLSHAKLKAPLQVFREERHQEGTWPS